MKRGIRRVILLLVLLSVMFFAFASLAQAATPQDIYNDFADNGKLDHSYTTAELNAFLKDATIQQYGSSTVIGPLTGVVNQLLASGERQTFPFTGFEMLMAVLGALVLVVLGFALRRSARS